MLLLSRYLAEAVQRPFGWGSHDCVLFAAGWAERLTGTDPAARWRGRYASADDAEAMIDAEGGIAAGMHAALTATGWRPLPPDIRMAGDIVLAEPPGHDGQRMAGVAVDRRRVALVTARGLVIARVPVVKAWVWESARG